MSQYIGALCSQSGESRRSTRAEHAQYTRRLEKVAMGLATHHSSLGKQRVCAFLSGHVIHDAERLRSLSGWSWGRHRNRCKSGNWLRASFSTADCVSHHRRSLSSVPQNQTLTTRGERSDIASKDNVPSPMPTHCQCHCTLAAMVYIRVG